LVNEISLYYDALPEKHQNSTLAATQEDVFILSETHTHTKSTAV